MQIQSVEFLTSAVRTSDFPRDEFPEVAIVGRSNVGKSSLINRLVSAKGLARVSSTPGKTRLVNFFKVRPRPGTGLPFCIVDLPGYGYAKVSRETKLRWSGLIEGYIAHRNALAGIVSLLDLRHGPSPLDEQLDLWIRPRGVPVIRVVTKADLLTRSARADRVREWKKSASSGGEDELILVSAKTGEGCDTLLARMVHLADARRSRGGLGLG